MPMTVTLIKKKLKNEQTKNVNKSQKHPARLDDKSDRHHASNA
jgi:hypothetical protein